MKSFKKILTFILISIFISNCGFKVVNKSNEAKFKIVNIYSTGERKLNYKIKNSLLFNSNPDQKNELNLNLETVKNKTIKEKNISNSITKYQISINVTVTLIELSKFKTDKFNITKTGYYNVSSQHSQTINNEKKLLDLLADEISDDIFNEITNRLDAI